MKIKLLFVLLFVCSWVNAQDINKILLNGEKIITVVFPSGILNATTGSKSIFIDYDKSGSASMLFIKTKAPFNETNLLVKTTDNYVYNINVGYEKDSKKVVNIFKVNKALGILVGDEVVEEKADIALDVQPISDSKNVRDNDYTIGNTTINDSENNKVDCSDCESILKKNKKVKRIFEENNNIKLQLHNVVYRKGKLYVVVEIDNNSNVDFNINYIKTFIDSGKKSKHASAQYLEKNPILIYNAARTVEHHKSRKYVFAYDQFSIDMNKNMTFELNENNGERHIFLKVSNRIINNPIN